MLPEFACDVITTVKLDAVNEITVVIKDVYYGFVTLTRRRSMGVSGIQAPQEEDHVATLLRVRDVERMRRLWTASRIEQCIQPLHGAVVQENAPSVEVE